MIGQIFCNTLKIIVDLFRWIALYHLSSFINKRYSDTIFYRLFHCISINRRTEFGISILFLHCLFFRIFTCIPQKRCSRKSNESSLRQNVAHIVIHRTVITAMRLINKDKHFVRVFHLCTKLNNRFKFIDKRSDNDFSFIFQQRFQSTSRLCSRRLHCCIRKVISNLLIQIDTVGNN